MARITVTKNGLKVFDVDVATFMVQFLKISLPFTVRTEASGHSEIEDVEPEADDPMENNER